MKAHLKLSVIATAYLGAAGVLLALLTARAATAPQSLPAVVPAAKSAPVTTAQSVLSPAPMVGPVMIVTNTETSVAHQPGVLDQSRQFALGMIETGNDDREIGGAGEVSRYQIMPVVWHQFSDSLRYRDPAISQQVAQQLWARLYARFKEQAHREPTDFDMYVLWNTRYGYYANKGFNPKKLGPTVRDRAQRFVNLVERADLDSDGISGVAKS
jgi:hypothetical protein